jgi:cytoskeletal protein CcmA (bactofilin family)
MAAAAPAPSPSPTPSAPPVAPPRRPLGVLRDVGSVRRDTVRTDRWTASGTVKVLGAVDAAEVRLGGLVSLGGTLRARTLALRGTVEVGGATEITDTLRGDGIVHLHAPFRAGSADLRGTIRSGSDVRVDRDLRLVGVLEAPSVHVGLLDFAGRMAVPGDVEATGLVRVRFTANSEVGVVRARSVVLRGPPSGVVPSLWRKVFGGSVEAHVERVEADSVELESVDVYFVRAPSIVLGPGAHVAALEGTVVRQHPSAYVGRESRTPPPHGLSR